MSTELRAKGSHWWAEQPSTELLVLGGLSTALTAGDADVRDKSALPCIFAP